MHSALAIGAVLLAGLSGSAADDGLSLTLHQFIPGGHYKIPTSVGTDGSCPKVDQPYSSSPIAPLDEELSVLWRGPGQLLQIAVYNKDTSNTKRSMHARRSHRHFHERHAGVREREAELEQRGCGTWVTTPDDGTFQNTYGCTPAELVALQANPGTPPAAAAASPTAAAPPTGAAPSAAPTFTAGPGNWNRVAQYDSASGNASGLVFQANNKWTGYALAEVLGYTATDGQSPSDTPTILGGDVVFADEQTLIISSDQPCNNDCAPSAPGADAHHGWAGDEKMFMFEYTMPKSGNTETPNADMPSLWMLNTNIVNIQQFSLCSPWASGAGELDVHEVLEHGADVGYTSLHMGHNYAGTVTDSPHPRPSTGSQKLAVIFTGGQVYIEILGDSASFDPTISSDTVTAYLNPADRQVLFAPTSTASDNSIAADT